MLVPGSRRKRLKTPNDWCDNDDHFGLYGTHRMYKCCSQCDHEDHRCGFCGESLLHGQSHDHSKEHGGF